MYTLKTYRLTKVLLPFHCAYSKIAIKIFFVTVERTVLECGFKELGLSVIYADVVLRNTHSQHVLEKIGFEYLQSFLIYKY